MCDDDYDDSDLDLFTCRPVEGREHEQVVVGGPEVAYLNLKQLRQNLGRIVELCAQPTNIGTIKKVVSSILDDIKGAEFE